MNDAWQDRLGRVPGAGELERRDDGLWMQTTELDVAAMAMAMDAAGARLITITGLPRGDGEVTLIYHYAVPGTVVAVRTASRQRAMPSIGLVTPAAQWIEREIADLYGVRFDGHPDPRRLVRPPALAPGFFERSEDGE